MDLDAESVYLPVLHILLVTMAPKVTLGRQFGLRRSYPSPAVLHPDIVVSIGLRRIPIQLLDARYTASQLRYSLVAPYHHGPDDTELVLREVWRWSSVRVAVKHELSEYAGDNGISQAASQVSDNRRIDHCCFWTLTLKDEFVTYGAAHNDSTMVCVAGVVMVKLEILVHISIIVQREREATKD